MNAIPLPRFDFAETERIARMVGFNTTPADLAREYLRGVANNGIEIPDGLSARQQLRALFCVDLGWFIYERYIEPGEPLPDTVRNWYELNTALTAGGIDATGLFAGRPDEP